MTPPNTTIHEEVLYWVAQVQNAVAEVQEFIAICEWAREWAQQAERRAANGHR